jgi:hypothetical protein
MPQRLSRSMLHIFALSAFFVGAGGTASADRNECKDNCQAASDLRAQDCEAEARNRGSICLAKQSASSRDQCLAGVRDRREECMSNVRDRWQNCRAGCDTAYPH